MSKNKWTYEELLKKKPNLDHKKKRVFKNSYVVQFWDQPSRTIISHLYKDGNQFIHPDHNQERTLTVRESARLQSFPDNFILQVHELNNLNKSEMLYHQLCLRK